MKVWINWFVMSLNHSVPVIDEVNTIGTLTAQRYQRVALPSLSLEEGVQPGFEPTTTEVTGANLSTSPLWQPNAIKESRPLYHMRKGSNRDLNLPTQRWQEPICPLRHSDSPTSKKLIWHNTQSKVWNVASLNVEIRSPDLCDRPASNIDKIAWWHFSFS
jgi:hypothetical protein